jgi:N-acetylneuraminic acid mutarotase
MDLRGVTAGDPVGCYVRGGVTLAADAVTSTGYTVDTWHKGIFVETSATNHKIYIDGSSVGSSVQSATPAGENKMAVGALPYSGGWANFFAGKIAEVCIWNIALNASDIAALQAGAIPSFIQSASIVAYWKLYDDALDTGGDQLDLELVDSPTFDTTDHPDIGGTVSLTGGVFPPVQLTDIPEAKEQFGFEELNGVLYAVCGITTGGVHSKTVYAYDIGAGTWSRKADAPLSMQSPILRAVNGKLYLIGGYRSDLLVKYDTVYEYDPDLDTWTQKADMPYTREDHGSAVVDGKIYIFGGLMEPAHTMVPWIDVYDPATNTWEASRAWVVPRALGDYCEAYQGKIYLVSSTANMTGYATDLNATQQVDKYDPETDTFTTLTNIPLAVCYKEVVCINGIMYVISGVHASTLDYVNTDEVYDIALDAWKTIPNLAYAARGIGVTTYNGKIYFCGGSNKADGVEVELAHFYELTPQSIGVSGASGTLSKKVPFDTCTRHLFEIPSDLSRVT